MARRSSARLRGRNSTTPKRVSLSHDAQPQTPRTAPGKLAALNESDEMPGAFPSSASPPPRFVQTVQKPSTAARPVESNTGTPGNTTPIKPAEEEMHPKQHQQSTAKPLQEARWLGFSDMHPQTERPKQGNKLADLQATPTSTPALSGASVASPKVQFMFNREQSLELSPAAKRLMEETREEAVRIREQMIAREDEDPSQNGNLALRKIATPKTRKGRFSNAHQAEFSKMDSIASHHSVRRGPPKQEGALNISVATPGQKTAAEGSPTKSLKRKQSRADLDESDRYPQHNNALSTATKPAIPIGSHLPRPTSSNNLTSSPSKWSLPSPSKRVRVDTLHVTTYPQQSSTPGDNVSTPARQPQYPDLSSLASPTQASLARTASTKAASKIPGPNLVRSPSKPALKPQPQHTESPKSSTPLLARSPSKAALFERTIGEAPKAQTSASPLLLRSPTKPTGSKKPETEEAAVAGTDSHVKPTPLLARSPLKVSVVKEAEKNNNDHVQVNHASDTLLLHKSPTKLPALMSQSGGDSAGTPSKTSENGSGILGRFQLLRSSPMKSILRSPQRLYSDDPAKIAAGTHLATPPKHALGNKQNGTAQKRVDFTSSTKSRYERAQSELSSTPSRQSKSPKESEPIFAAYPTLPTRTNEEEVVVTPQRRRQTTVPGDFTFKAGSDSITFGQSPNTPIAGSGGKRASTIRHVSAEPVFRSALTQAAGSKRKFGDDNNALGSFDKQENEPAAAASDKENEEEERPPKRLKKTASEEPAKPVAKPAPTKRPTLGVKPKKEQGMKSKKEQGMKSKKEQGKKPSVISKARLDALSQPKRR